MKLLLLLCALLLPCIATAGERWNRPQAYPSEAGRQAQVRVSMGDAMDMVARATGGRVLLAQPVTVNGHEAYRIKVLTRHGEVRVVYVDAETGDMR